MFVETVALIVERYEKHIAENLRKMVTGSSVYPPRAKSPSVTWVFTASRCHMRMLLLSKDSVLSGHSHGIKLLRLAPIAGLIGHG